MLAYLKGKILYTFDGGVVLENNGIGYEIFCSNSAFNRLVKDNGGGVYTYLQVREDGISLFGFDNLEEKEMFLKLISVSGVGPKMGISILSGMNLSDLVLSIANADIKRLTQIKGLGKKTAERLVVELKESVNGKDISSILSSGGASIKEQAFSRVEEDAIAVLINLGFSRSQCVSVIGEAKSNGISEVEEIIAYALKNMR